MSSRPYEQGGQVEHPVIGGGDFVVAGGDRSILFEPVETAFDHVAAPVLHRIERGRATTDATPARPVGLLIDAFGNRRGDPPTAQVSADRAGGLSLVGQHPPWPLPRLTRPGFGIQIPAGTSVNIVQSLTLPAVSTTVKGRP